jgi:hypothetical protein
MHRSPAPLADLDVMIQLAVMSMSTSTRILAEQGPMAVHASKLELA